MLFTHIQGRWRYNTYYRGISLLRSCKMQIYINLHILTHLHIFPDIHIQLIWPLVCDIFHADTHTHTRFPLNNLWALINLFCHLYDKVFHCGFFCWEPTYWTRECSVILKIGCNIGMFIHTYENIYTLSGLTEIVVWVVVTI